MSDLISRQKAIDAMANAIWHYPNECYQNLNAYEFAKSLAEFGLKDLPSAQPELCEDTVSRQRLLNDLKELITAWKKYPVMAKQIKGVEAAIEYVKAIPPAGPERKKGEWTTEQVAELLANLFGDECSCNFSGIDEWLPYACKYSETTCPEPKEKHGCWMQFLLQGGADMRGEDE